MLFAGTPTQDAPAAWIPIIFEIAGCLLVLSLKLFYEQTSAGRRLSAAKQQRQQIELSLAAHGHDAEAAETAGRRQSFSNFVQAAALAVSSSGDLGWRGCAVLGDHQSPPVVPVTPMIDCSVHEGSRHGSRYSGSWHGGRAYSMSAAQAAPQPAVGSPTAVRPSASANKVDKQVPDAGTLVKGSGSWQDRERDPEVPAVQVRCLGSAVSSSSSMAQDYDTNTRTGSSTALLGPVRQQQSQQQQPPLEPLYAAMWSPPPPSPVNPPAEARGRSE